MTCSGLASLSSKVTSRHKQVDTLLLLLTHHTFNMPNLHVHSVYAACVVCNGTMIGVPMKLLCCAELSGEQAQKPEDSGPGSVPRSYVLKPIDGSLLYLRRGKDVRQSEAEAIQEADITLQSISLHLSSASHCLMAGTRLL